jgi:hypothetical protein
LIGTSEVLFVDAAGDIDGSLVSGSIVVFTTNLVLEATLTKAPTLRQNDRNPPETSTVQVQAWSRGALIAATLETDQTRAANVDVLWQGLSDDEAWPYLGQIKFAYRDGQVLTLPLRQAITEGHREAFREIVPALLADLH